MRGLALVLMCAAFAAESAHAELYKVQARRLDSNLYELDRGKAYALTRYCYEYTYGDDAIVDWSGYGGDIVFKDSGTKCDIKKLLSPISPDGGLYKLSVSRESDNLYEIVPQGVFLKTDLCLELALMDDAILDWDGTSGELLFKNAGTKCDVHKILGPMR